MRIALAIFVLLALDQTAADCESDIQEYIQGLDPTQPKLWSIEMLDSSVKFPSDGIFQGAPLTQLGNYDQCIAIKGPNDDSGAPRFKGQYCHFNVAFDSPAEFKLMNETLTNVIQLRRNVDELIHRDQNPFAQTIDLPFLWAVCAPSSCEEEGVKKVADLNLAAFANVLGFEANSSIRRYSCYSEDDRSKTFDAATWCFVAFAIILALWIVFSTAYEYFNPKIENSGWKILVKSFSLQTNLGDLFKLPSNPAPGQLGCLHGIRVMSMMWMILGHTYAFGTDFPGVDYLYRITKASKDWKMAPMMNAFLCVDSFLFLSGLLVTYVPIMDYSKGRKFSIWKYYIYRYLRVTPALAVVIWYVSTLQFYLSHGPTWYSTAGSSMRACHRNWWPTLLYITNYFYSYCVSQSWYLMVEMQLALLAPIIIIPLIKWPKYGLGLIGFFTCASLGAIFGVTYVKNYPWTYIIKLGYNNGRYMFDFYTNTPLRAVPYLVGMALGYILSRRKIKIPNWGVALGWFFSTATCLTVVYSVLYVYRDDYVYEPVGASFYASLHKLGWGLGLAWIVWACVNGYGGPVNSILAWKYFLPLSKISFAAYLLQTDLINFHAGLRRTAISVAFFEMFYKYCGFLILLLPLSVLLHISIEAPVMNILRSVFKKAVRNGEKMEKSQKGN